MACDLNIGSGHTAYHHASLVDLRPLPIHQISVKSDKLFVDGWTYGRADRHLRHTIRSTWRSRPSVWVL